MKNLVEFKIGDSIPEDASFVWKVERKGNFIRNKLVSSGLIYDTYCAEYEKVELYVYEVEDAS